MLSSQRFAARIALGALGRTAEYLTGRHRPWILNHLVTVRCNLSCPFCYVSGPEQKEYNSEHYPKRAEMTTSEVQAFYRELVRERFMLAVIVGGEPLLRTDLDDMLGVLRGHLYVSVFSNGLVLEDRVELVRSATNLFVSLDAPDEEHDVLRDRPSTFRRAVAGIEAVRRRYPKIDVAVNMTVTGKNAHRVGEMISFTRELGVPVSFQPPTYQGQFTLEDRPVTPSAENVPDAEVVAEAFRRIDEAARRGDRIIGSRSFFSQVIQDRRTYPCHYPTYVLGPVLPDGAAVGCTTGQVMGSVRDGNVRNLLRSGAFADNARAGRCCEVGCRDWGIYDLSALYERRFSLSDARRYGRALARRAPVAG